MVTGRTSFLNVHLRRPCLLCVTKGGDGGAGRHTCCHQVSLMSLQGKGGYTELVLCVCVCMGCVSV